MKETRRTAGSVHFAWKADVKNETAEPYFLRAVVVKFIDADGFAIGEAAALPSLTIAPGETQTVTDTTLLSIEQWGRVHSVSALAK